MTISLCDWQQRWGIPDAAIAELVTDFTHSAPGLQGDGESAIQAQVRLEAAKLGLLLCRNNVGAGTLDNGNFIRWGLANDSANLNKAVKSADLIGIRRVLIEPYHVGGVIGQFVSREVKRAGWRYGDSATERAQLKWATIVNSYGGDAKFTNGAGSFLTAPTSLDRVKGL